MTAKKRKQGGKTLKAQKREGKRAVRREVTAGEREHVKSREKRGKKVVGRARLTAKERKQGMNKSKARRSEEERAAFNLKESSEVQGSRALHTYSIYVKLIGL